MRRNIHSLLFAAALLLMITGSSCRKEKQSYETIPVAGLFSLTGNWSSLGITSKAAIEIAVEEINSDFEARDIPFRFSASVYNTQLDTLKALQAIQSAWNSGIRMVVGPQSSAEVSALKSFADTSDMLVVSQGSRPVHLPSNSTLFSVTVPVMPLKEQRWRGPSTTKESGGLSPWRGTMPAMSDCRMLSKDLSRHWEGQQKTLWRILPPLLISRLCSTTLRHVSPRWPLCTV